MNLEHKHFNNKYSKLIILFVVPILLFVIEIDSRSNIYRPACISTFSANYISDGQDHSLYFDSIQSNTIKIHFSNNIEYRIDACNNQSANFLLEIYDNNGNLIYSSIKNPQNNNWTLKFDDPMDCNLKLTKLSPEKTAVAVNLLIGFKP